MGLEGFWRENEEKAEVKKIRLHVHYVEKL